jgi:hypothetical protein
MALAAFNLEVFDLFGACAGLCKVMDARFFSRRPLLRSGALSIRMTVAQRCPLHQSDLFVGATR